MIHKFQNATHPVVRKVWITVPAQRTLRRKQTLQVIALPLPRLVPELPRKGNRTKPCLIQNLIEPQVRVVETGEELFRFDPPLKITVEFTEEDVATARACAKKLKLKMKANDKPPISLYTYWRDGNRLRWKQVKPDRVTWDRSGKRGTMTARIWTLKPKDPVADGCP